VQVAARRGDVVVSIDGQAVHSTGHLRNMIAVAAETTPAAARARRRRF
jgi:S1-C subfamily serine protease